MNDAYTFILDIANACTLYPLSISYPGSVSEQTYTISSGIQQLLLNAFTLNSVLVNCEPTITYKTYINGTEGLLSFLTFDSSTQPTYLVQSSDQLDVGFYIITLEATSSNGYYTVQESVSFELTIDEIII